METSEKLNDNQKQVIHKHLGNRKIDAENFSEWCTQVENNWDACLRQNGTKLKTNQKGRGNIPLVKQIQP